MSHGSSMRTLAQRFAANLEAVFAAVAPLRGGLALAYSGGLDSSVLLVLAAAYAKQQQLPLHALHIHHGLSPHADAWVAHCAATCAALQVPFAFERVSVNRGDAAGLEGSARSARYLALGRLCLATDSQFLMAAHHQDDQAETLLMQMLRGSGVAGLSGMDSWNTAPNLLGHPSLVMLRPLLQESRVSLAEYAAEHALQHIEDESNADLRFTRNALRHQVMPLLENIVPGFAARMGRAAQHTQAAQALIEALAADDMAACRLGDGLAVSALQALSDERINHVLRLWLGQSGARMPSTARLLEMRKQLFAAKDNARITIYHEALALHRYQGCIYAAPRQAPVPLLDQYDEALPVLSQDFFWRGEAVLDFPAFRGRLHFHAAEHGFAREYMQQQCLTLHLRRGGERLKLAANRPTRDMKSHYQSLQIPFWIRQQLPFVSSGAQLLYAAGVGMQAAYCSEQNGEKYALEWVPDPAAV